MLVTHGPEGLDANHIPFDFDADKGPHGTLLAHVARANDVWQCCPSGTPMMVVFRGADGYISPNWHPSKHESHHWGAADPLEARGFTELARLMQPLA